MARLNLDCGQFIKTSNILNIGGVLPSSTLSGAQIEGTLAFYRDPATGNWILFFVDSAGNYIQSGYYPASTYGSGQLSHYTQFIEFGGEIYAPVPAATSTDMGSGKFSNTWDSCRQIFIHIRSELDKPQYALFQASN
jgi:hypothetical protein